MHIRKIVSLRELCCRLDLHKEGLGLPKDHPALSLFDCWSVHKSEDFRNFLKDSVPWLNYLYIPAGYTSKLQLYDVAAQWPFKAGFKDAYNEYASDIIKKVRRRHRQRHYNTQLSQLLLALLVSCAVPFFAAFHSTIQSTLNQI